jgi:uncharacterized protein (TIGR02217 family)
MKYFLDFKFPTDMPFGIEVGPEFLTEITTTISGEEYRQSKYFFPRKKYVLTTILQTREEIEKLANFFYLMKGRFHSFRFNDLLDNAVDNQLLAIGDGTTKKFQLIKSYFYNYYKLYDKIIHKPVHETIKICVNHQATTKFTIDENGIVSFKTAPKLNAKITIRFNFDIIVRFDNDYLPVIFNHDGLYRVDNLRLIEVIN